MWTKHLYVPQTSITKQFPPKKTHLTHTRHTYINIYIGLQIILTCGRSCTVLLKILLTPKYLFDLLMQLVRLIMYCIRFKHLIEWMH